MKYKKNNNSLMSKEDALFDAFTEYYKNDWRKTGRSRISGRIQVGNSNTYLIKSVAYHSSDVAYIYGHHHWVVYKLNHEYDMKNFSRDFSKTRGWNEDYAIGIEFQLDEISSIEKRRTFIQRVIGRIDM